MIIHNADIITMTGHGDRASAVLIDNGIIVAVGKDEDIIKLNTAGTNLIDAGGATLLPGFIESHMHLFLGAASLQVLPLFDVRGLKALTKAIRTFAADNPSAPLLICQGVQYSLLGENVRPDRHILDQIISDRPLFLQSADFHNAWCNTIALEKAGILTGFDAGSNSSVEMGEDGLATGVLVEHAAASPVIRLSSTGGREMSGLEGFEPNATSDQREDDKVLLKIGLNYCAAQGITTIINMDGNLYQAELLAELEAEDELTCRVELPYHFTPGKPLESLDVATTIRSKLASDKLWCNKVKLFIDGVLDTHTAYRLHDYPGKPGDKGKPLHNIETFNEIVTEADRRGFQISVHAIGDGAVRCVLDSYEVASNVNGKRDSRHRIEHIELIDPADIPRFHELGIVASVQPVHPPGCANFPLEPTISIIGKDQWENAYLWRTLVENGAQICFASDWPIAAVEPLIGIETAITRRPWAEDLPDQCLSFEQTLHAYTAGGAYAAHKEDKIGSIAPGMAADLVLLNKAISPANISDVKVTMTICDGKKTYSTFQGSNHVH